MAEIPNVFHFVFGLVPKVGPMHVVHYLCLESCRRVYRPDAIHFHCRHEPHGEWWERIRPHLTLHRVEREWQDADTRRYAQTEEGRFIERAGWTYAHEADFRPSLRGGGRGWRRRSTALGAATRARRRRGCGRRSPTPCTSSRSATSIGTRQPARASRRCSRPSTRTFTTYTASTCGRTCGGTNGAPISRRSTPACSADHIRTIGTTYNVIARGFLD